MDFAESPRPVQVRPGADGSMTYLVDTPAAALPAVRMRDLAAAWDAARAAAIAADWGPPRGFRFRGPDGGFTDLALADRDARCWAAAVDAAVGLSTSYGMSVCLRLLALVDLIAHAGWAAGLVAIRRGGAELDPSLLRAAARAPLTDEARFDETGFRALLTAALGPTGASA